MEATGIENAGGNLNVLDDSELERRGLPIPYPQIPEGLIRTKRPTNLTYNPEE